MRSLFRLPGLAGLLALAILVEPGAAEALEGIGYVRGVRANAYGTPPQLTRNPLYALDIVVPNEVVETVKRGALHIKFHDGSEFRLGSASRATLDSFLFDPSSADGQFELSLRSGIFRLKTGRIKKEGILVVTPVAFIGVRGTDFIVQVLVTGAIIVAVIEGAITISPLFPGGIPAIVTAGSTAAVGTDGRVTTGVVAPPSDSGLDQHIPGASREGEGGDDGGGEGGD